jgi:flagellar protein FlgJ
MVVISANAAAAETTTQATDHRKLTAAAQQFEAMFLEQMMKPFSGQDEDDKDAGEDQAAGSGTYQSLGVESMATAISRAGGFGIARSVVASIERQQGRQVVDQKT